MENTQHIHNRISGRGFDLSCMDMKRLRGKYQRIRFDIPHGLVRVAKRKVMVDAVLADEFGQEAMDDYNAQVAEWEECRKLVQGKEADFDDARFFPPKEPKRRRARRPKATKGVDSQKKQLSRKHGC